MSYPELCKLMKEDSNYKVLGGQCAQQTLKSVVESDLPLTEISIKGCAYIKISQIAEIRIIPQNQQFYAEYVYQATPVQSINLDYSLALGIDHGVTNWLTCLSNQGQSFIVDGRKLKSINQGYNRLLAKLKQGKSAKYWDKNLSRLTDKRNNQVRDAINKVARFVVNYCLSHQIGNIVFGWNSGNKNGIDIGKKNNQTFVQIPTARLKKRIEELCSYYGIIFTETEESYTSRSSFLDNDLLPKFGEKLTLIKL